jgi:mRNA interferase RelE/StbE
MTYQVTFKASADKALDKLPKSLQARILQKATLLATNPRPSGSVKLTGASALWRLRIGDYRMVYLIDDQGKTVDIRIIAHRREVYRGL